MSTFQEELETVRKDVVTAQDRVATSLYTLLAQEATCAENLRDYLHKLKVPIVVNSVSPVLTFARRQAIIIFLLGTLFDPCRLAYLAYTSND